MRRLKKGLACALMFTAFGILSADNQTLTTTPVQSEYDLPFRLKIQQANFSLPNGIHSYACAEYDNKWLFIGGRTNGMHGFNTDGANFPPQEQNTLIYVVNPATRQVYTRSLYDAFSGLTQAQIDTLSVTSPQYYQRNDKLYMTGGYGITTSSGEFDTKDKLTAFDIPGLMNWVVNSPMSDTAAQHIRQISDPTFKVTGGQMARIENGPTLLMFGQDFNGLYFEGSNGNYTEQIRRFNIHDDGVNLSATILTPNPVTPDPSYRRRDLNVAPVMSYQNGVLTESLVALSGVFTLSTGVWTVPIEINADGSSVMANPNSPDTFKQGMNNYTSAVLGTFSEETGKMYNVLLGGITYGYFDNGQFQTDPMFPFTNEVTTVQINKNGRFSQHLMSAEYPVILSQGSNPGNQFLFGAAGQIMLPFTGPFYSNGVLNFDEIGMDPFLAGYVVGGIASTLPNTNTMSDSTASPYIFKVMLTKVPVYDGCQTYNVTENTLGSKAGAVILDCATLKTMNPVNSPTQITIRAGGGTFDTNGFDSTLSGVIWGRGPFTKVGEGILTLTGDSSSYVGTTTVNGGVFRLAQGSKLGGTLNVESGSFLDGTGTAGQLLSNRGIVAPGNSPGTMYVAGDYIQHNEGVLIFSMNASGGSTLQVNSNAAISGALVVNNPTNYVPPIGTVYTPLYAGSVNGTFTHGLLNLTPTVVLQPEYFSNGLWLRVQRDYVNAGLLPILNKNQIAIGEMLNRVAPGANPDLNSVLTAIDTLGSGEQVADAYNELMPRTVAIESEIAFSQATLQVKNLIKRMEFMTRRCGGVSYNGQYDPCSIFDNLGVFLTATGLFTNQDENDCNAAYSTATGAFTLGADYLWGNDFSTGVFFGYGRSQANLERHGGKLFINAWQAGLYTSWSWCKFNFDGIFSYGWNDYNIERDISFSYVDRTAKANPDGNLYTLYGSVGYELCANNWILEPLVSLQYVSLNVNGYREHDADSLDLKVNGQHVNSFQAAAGATLNYPIRISLARIMPTFRAFYVYEFDDGCRTVKAELAKVPDSGFKVREGAKKQGFYVLGGGLSVLMNENVMIFLDYDGEFGRGDYIAQAVQGGFRYEF